jgi:predicted component of type VI protein secretion system
MDPVQTQLLLDKINALWNSSGSLSALERDLMLSYLRQLYAAVLEAPVAVLKPPQPQVRTASPASSTQIPVRPVVTPSPQPVAQPVREVQQPAPQRPPAPAPAPPPAAVEKPAAVEQGHKAADILFNIRTGSELSDRLSRQPIADLTRAFSINDRLLYTNDLFHKDQQAFAESVRQLDAYGDLATARRMITDLAHRYDWLHEERLETAQAFVQLISRRYINQ